MRDGEQAPGCSMNVHEKLKLARQLETLGVDAVEAGFAVSSPEDFEAVRSIAGELKHTTVVSLARLKKEDIDRAWEALSEAKSPRIHLFIATSDVHLKYKLQMSREEVLSAISEFVAYAKTLCADIEFSCEDASRSEREFLASAVETAIEAGANIINIPDTVGYATPVEMYELVKYIRETVKGSDKAEFSVHCHNDLGMATACSLASVLGGATQIECTVNGIGERAGNASLEEIVMGLHTRSDYYDAVTAINTRQIYRTSKLLSTITGVAVPPNKAIVGANAFAHESGIHQHGVMKERTTYEIMSPDDIGIPQNKMVLGKHSGRHAFLERVETLGYVLNDEDIDKAFESFKQLAEKKKTITDRDVEALISHNAAQSHKAVKYISYVINSGNTITSTAVVKLSVEGEIKEKVATGEGPIDACFKAIDKIVKQNISLENYTIQSVTEGVDALGEVSVQIKKGNSTVIGRGLSTDIIESSVKAYLNAINKII